MSVGMSKEFDGDMSSVARRALPVGVGVDLNFDPDTGVELPSLTRQEFRDECDINEIMRRYQRDGVVSHVTTREPMYQDFTQYPDLQESMNYIRDAEMAFLSLPSAVRREFDNDPVKFVQFAAEPKNGERLVELGLAEPKPVAPAPMKVEVVEPVVKAPKASDKPSKGD